MRFLCISHPPADVHARALTCSEAAGRSCLSSPRIRLHQILRSGTAPPFQLTTGNCINTRCEHRPLADESM